MRTLTKDDILAAIKNTKSNAQAGRWLGVSKVTYKKYASMYYDEYGVNLYEKHNNKYGLGVSYKSFKLDNRPAIYDILEGKVPASTFKASDLKAMALKEGLLQEECSCCGFKEERITDRKVPLMLAFRDFNKHNFTLDNLELLCYNCYFLQIGDVFTRKQMEAIEGLVVTKKDQEVQQLFDLSRVDMAKLEDIITNKYNGEDLSGEDLIVRH